MGSEFLKGLDSIDWASLGYPEMPQWLRDLSSDNREVRLRAYHKIHYLIADAGSQSPENYGPIKELLKTEMPIYIVPFLLELLQNDQVANKDIILQAIDDLATYPDLLKVSDEMIYKVRAKTVFEEVKVGLPVYQALLSDTDVEVRKMAKQVLETIKWSDFSKII